MAKAVAEVSGSPPHTWGIPKPEPAILSTLRITPTYMGNTKEDDERNNTKQDHPHIHGEYHSRFDFMSNSTGSPPHTWGIRNRNGEFQSGPRITPTYMGNTHWHAVRGVVVRDHPHIHGEYLAAMRQLLAKWGSPPHTWGIPGSNGICSSWKRITPTYMGNTE